jgi:hypothetical protein
VLHEPLYYGQVAPHGSQVKSREAFRVSAWLQRGAVVVQDLQTVQAVVASAQMNRIVACKIIKIVKKLCFIRTKDKIPEIRNATHDFRSEKFLHHCSQRVL